MAVFASQLAIARLNTFRLKFDLGVGAGFFFGIVQILLQ
jgi:hypothetical protein